MVENYPTALRSLVLAENSISPELQQQICDLLSEGEEEEEVVAALAYVTAWVSLSYEWSQDNGLCSGKEKRQSFKLGCLYSCTHHTNIWILWVV